MNNSSINWFPGHMAKSLTELQQISKFVDFWFEVVDARAPISSQGSFFTKIIRNKPKIVVLGKSDLADNRVTNSWISFFKTKNIIAIKFDKNLKIKPSVLYSLQKLKINKKPGILTRAAVVGAPNVGKSCFINNLIGNRKLKVENRAGVTRSLNWISLGKMEICDTPGILPTKIDNDFSRKIAYLGLIKSEILDKEELVLNLLSDLGHVSPTATLLEFARSNGCLLAGDKLDLNRASELFLKKFREGKFGRISLEVPD